MVATQLSLNNKEHSSYMLPSLEAVFIFFILAVHNKEPLAI